MEETDVTKTFVCVDCEQVKETQTSGGTGYVIDNDDRICYACCAVRDVAYMAENKKICLYLSKDEVDRWQVTNWPGTLTFRTLCHSSGNHNFTGARRDVWFKDRQGKVWWGVQYGHNTQVLHCTKTVQKWGR